ncbi:MAG: hypothetical protein RBS07_05215 [Lentimicrobium sp.]|jgi:hypothetical protein|nr:hypothetical protein [Lentimicrobium sp.]
MKQKIFSLLFLLNLMVQTAMGQANAAFPQLKWINLGQDATYPDGKFGYDPAMFTYIGKELQKLPKTDVCFEANNNDKYTLIGRYKTSSMKESLNILFTPGASGDPQFRISDVGNKVLWEQVADEMCINGNGVIYTAGNTDKMFNERRKYQLSNTKVNETKQPFCYVGVKGKLLKPITLYTQKKGGTVVANLPVGYEIEVLLAEEDYTAGEYGEGLPMNYLARTAFGLVGWLRLTEDDIHNSNPVLRGLGYMGD